MLRANQLSSMIIDVDKVERKRNIHLSHFCTRSLRNYLHFYIYYFIRCMKLSLLHVGRYFVFLICNHRSLRKNIRILPEKINTIIVIICDLCLQTLLPTMQNYSHAIMYEIYRRLCAHVNATILFSAMVVEICMLPPCRLGISIASASEPSVASKRFPNAATAATAATTATVTKCPGSC